TVTSLVSLNISESLAEPTSGSDQYRCLVELVAVVSTLKVCPPKLCNWPAVVTGGTLGPPSTKSPSQVPDVPASRLPEFAAEEKYRAPAAVTSFTAWATTPAFVLEITGAA